MIGRTVSHYHIIDKLGQGGMGEVYLAEDLSLKRKVALKILPGAFATDAERLARFEREAEAVAALNHPNIVTIHSVDRDGDIRFLTMELVEGQRLDRLIPGAGMSTAELLRIAVPLADAIAAAHERGIVHRDLKPANIMLDARGRTKVLDFGLAKLRRDEPGAGAADTSTGVTIDGHVLGTTPYMSPEQIQGRVVDQRSDIFSLGIILYEMATGRRPFTGASGADVMSSILRDTPASILQSRPDHPRQLDRIVRHCLARDPESRFQTALDVRNELMDLEREIQSGSTEAVATAPPLRGASRRNSAWIAAAVVVGLGLVGSWYWRSARPAAGEASGHEASTAPRKLSQVTFSAALEEWPTWSPSGDRLAYSLDIDGFRQLALLPLDGSVATQLTHGSHDNIQPAWTPDGRALVFVRATRPGIRLEPGDVLGTFGGNGDIWRREVQDGSERRLVADAFNPAFSPDGGRLAFDAAWAGPRRIWITDANGINPRQATTDTSEAVVHTSPAWSPDGRRIAFRKMEHTRSDILLLDLDSEVVHEITNDVFPDLNPVWSPDGHFVYFSSYRGGGGINIWRVPISAAGDPSGPPEQVTTGAGNDLQLALAPSGDRMAFTVLQQNADIWRVPVDPVSGAATGTPEPLIATTREDSRAAWSADGKQVAFNSDRTGEMNLWIRSLADAAERQVTRGAGGDYQPNWSPDGRSLVFFSSRSGNADIWTVSLDDGSLRQLTTAPGLDINPAFSPDGRRIAFHSDRNGRMDLWVMNDDGSAQRQVGSTGAGGHFVQWSDDGRAIFYRDGTYFQGRVTRLDVETGQAEHFPNISGGHLSFSPDRSLIADLTEHRILWVFPLSGAAARKVLEFPEPNVRMDYSRWSPDGGWVLFDRNDPKGGDIWILEGIRR